MALIVKSRRGASSCCSPHTLSRSTRPLASTACVRVSISPRRRRGGGGEGGASAGVSTSARNVDVSMRSWPNCTCTIWNRRPMMRARRNSFCTWSGVASVATSKSFGPTFNSKSRTAPPTINARCPPCCRPSVTRIAFFEISAGSMPCTSADRITGTLGSRFVTAGAAFLRVLLRAGFTSSESGAVAGVSSLALSWPNSLRMSFLITWGEDFQDAPAADLRMRAQGVVGIGRDRVGDFLEKRNVVVRVAVEVAVFEVVQVFSHGREPRFGAHDLALAIARRARWAAGQLAVGDIVDRFDLARDQRFNPERPADRRRDERVRGGDEAAQIAGLLALAHEFQRRWSNGRRDDLAHELRVPVVQLSPRVLGER